MSLSTGATGSPNMPRRSAPSGRTAAGRSRARIGQEPEIFGIAMLDHPSNRNHPNAWFVRGYGPVGTNLPYFDGALTLDPGETWALRHRSTSTRAMPPKAASRPASTNTRALCPQP